MTLLLDEILLKTPRNELEGFAKRIDFSMHYLNLSTNFQKV